MFFGRNGTTYPASNPDPPIKANRIMRREYREWRSSLFMRGALLDLINEMASRCTRDFIGKII